MCPNLFSIHQIFHITFYMTRPFCYQSVNQCITTGICPICIKSAIRIYKLCDRPRIVDIFTSADHKTVIPLLHLFFIFPQLHMIERSKYLFLCKSKCSFIFMRGNGGHINMIHIRKHRFSSDSCDTGHKRLFQKWICSKCVIQKSSHKCCHTIPISMKVCFLHRRIILIQQNDRFFPIISV